MPCGDNGYRDGMSDIKDYNGRVARLTGRIKDLESWLCAILSELEKTCDGSMLIHDVENNGKAKGIFAFWQKHKEKDIERLEADLAKYSDHEKEIIKRILAGADE